MGENSHHQKYLRFGHCGSSKLLDQKIKGVAGVLKGGWEIFKLNAGYD